MEPLARLDRSLPGAGRELEHPGRELGPELVRHRPLVGIAKFGFSGDLVAQPGGGCGRIRARQFLQGGAGIGGRVRALVAAEEDLRERYSGPGEHRRAAGLGLVVLDLAGLISLGLVALRLIDALQIVLARLGAPCIVLQQEAHLLGEPPAHHDIVLVEAELLCLPRKQLLLHQIAQQAAQLRRRRLALPLQRKGLLEPAHVAVGEANLRRGQFVAAAVEPRIGCEQQGADDEKMQQRLPEELRPRLHRLPMRVRPGRTFMAISMIILRRIASAKVLKSLATIMNAPGPPITLSL